MGLPLDWEIPPEADLSQAPEPVPVENVPSTSLVSRHCSSLHAHTLATLPQGMHALCWQCLCSPGSDLKERKCQQVHLAANILWTAAEGELQDPRLASRPRAPSVLPVPWFAWAQKVSCVHKLKLLVSRLLVPQSTCQAIMLAACLCQHIATSAADACCSLWNSLFHKSLPA